MDEAQRDERLAGTTGGGYAQDKSKGSRSGRWPSVEPNGRTTAREQPREQCPPRLAARRASRQGLFDMVSGGRIALFGNLLREYGYDGGKIPASEFFHLAAEAGYKSKTGAIYAFSRLGYAKDSIVYSQQPPHLTYPDRKLTLEEIDKVRLLAEHLYPVDIAFRLKMNLRQVFFCLKGQDYIDLFYRD